MKKLSLTIAFMGLISFISFAQTNNKAKGKISSNTKSQHATIINDDNAKTNQQSSMSTTPSTTARTDKEKKQPPRKANKVYSKQIVQPVQAKKLPKDAPKQ